ncbi:hypothetical protein LTR94_024788 [Friedmanniomyces endolithicus]|nr:hypothetical protein LTR94_024788 [Friedmanniomyces endolithicus]
MVFTGRLAADPQISDDFGKAVFRLLEQRGTDNAGKPRLVGVNCVSWSKGLNEKVIARGLAQGCEAVVIGAFIDTAYTARDGSERTAKELVINRLTVLDWAEDRQAEAADDRGSGKKRASFRVLETTRFRRANGEPGERTTSFNCICFNEATAENYIQPYARKGSRVVIQGHVENDTWTGKDGVEHYDLRLVVSDIRLKNRRAASEPAASGSGVADRGVEAGGGYDLNDDIPF